METPVYSPRPIRCISYDDIYTLSDEDKELNEAWNDIETLYKYVRDLCAISNQIRDECPKKHVMENLQAVITDILKNIHRKAASVNDNTPI